MLLPDINVTYQPPPRMLTSERFYDQPTMPTTCIPRYEMYSDLRMVDDGDINMVCENSDTRTAAHLVAAQMISFVTTTVDIRQHMATGYDHSAAAA